MFDLMLGNAPEAFSCGEIYSWYRPWRTAHFEIQCPCGARPCPVWQRLKDVPEQRFHRAVVEQCGIEFVVDSSKDLCWVVDNQRWSREGGLRVINLAIWKDPLWHAYSFWKRGKSVAQGQEAFVKYYRRLLDLNIPLAAVNYNRLVKEPGSQLEEVCQLLGMRYFPGKERFWEKTHHCLFGNPGIPSQLKAAGGRIKEASLPADFLADYSRSSQKLAGPVREIAALLEAADISQLHSRPLEPSSILRKRLIYWYYRDKFRSFVRRYFPRPHPSWARAE